MIGIMLTERGIRPSLTVGRGHSARSQESRRQRGPGSDEIAVAQASARAEIRSSVRHSFDEMRNPVDPVIPSEKGLPGAALTVAVFVNRTAKAAERKNRMERP